MKATVHFSAQKQSILVLCALLVILPVLTESIYAPSLPVIAKSLAVTEGDIQQTFSGYLLGLAVGAIIWGHIADFFGRKPVIMIGLMGFLLGSLVGYYSASFTGFVLALLLQALFGSVSCLCQCVNRDVFNSVERVRVSSWIGTSVSVAPAVGAMMGGVITKYGHWRNIFVVLSVAAMAWLLVFVTLLPETKRHENPPSWKHLMQGVKDVFNDYNLLGYASIIGLGLGIMYTFFAEGAFYFNQLKQDKIVFPTICTAGALSYAGGCRLANHAVQQGYSYRKVMFWGLRILCGSMLVFSLFAYAIEVAGAGIVNTHPTLILMILLLWMLALLGLSYVLTPAFALALEMQSRFAGMAASWLTCFYNLITAVAVYGISLLQGKSLLIMPLYFLGLGLVMLSLLWVLLDKKVLYEHNGLEQVE